MENKDAIVYVVDDDPAVLESLEMLLQSVGLSVKTCNSARAFLDIHDADCGGCLVLDVRMPEVSGLELQKQLKELGLRIPVIFITGHGDVPVAVSAMKEGAVDFIQKPFSQQMLLEKIREALESDQSIRDEHEAQREVESRIKSLTPRERQVMDLVTAGRSNKQIAEDLGISQKTVEAHRARVMSKMAVDSLAELVERVVRLEVRAAESI